MANSDEIDEILIAFANYIFKTHLARPNVPAMTQPEAKAALQAYIDGERAKIVDLIIERYIPISLALNEYPKGNVIAYNEFRSKTIKNLEFLKSQLSIEPSGQEGVGDADGEQHE